MSNIVVGIGEILWDVFPSGKILGGAPANFAYHIKQFGLQSYAISAIGDDPLGNEIIDTLNDKKLSYILEKLPFPTGIVEVNIGDGGIPKYEICQNVAWDHIPFSYAIESLAQHTSTVCFGSLAQRSPVSYNTINQFINALPTNAFKVFDINLRQHFYTKPIIENSLHHCNILKINDEEVVLLANLFGWKSMTEIEICTALMHKYSIDIIVLTKGAEGSYVITPNDLLYQPTPTVHVADTVGAGDSFTAAFVASVLQGKPLAQAHIIAVQVAAFVCTQQGAMPPMPKSLIVM